MSYETVPLSPGLGAEVKGIDPAGIDTSGIEVLYQLWLKYHVLVIRNCPLTEENLIRFGGHFGPIEKARKMSVLATRPEIMVISNIREGKRRSAPCQTVSCSGILIAFIRKSLTRLGCCMR